MSGLKMKKNALQLVLQDTAGFKGLSPGLDQKKEEGYKTHVRPYSNRAFPYPDLIYIPYLVLQDLQKTR